MSGPRKLPEISGFLNNCGVHLVIPELLDSINHFALKEDGIEAKNSDAYKAHKNDYVLLKKKFEEYYAIQTLTWKQFLSILTTELKHNPLAQQILLGPVLREFMHTKVNEAKEQKAQPMIREVQADGRYTLLDIPTISRYLLQPLGVSVEAHELLPTFDGRALGYSVDTHPANNHPISSIDVYNMGKNHWERLPDDEVKAAESGIEKLHTDTPVIAQAFDYITSGTSKKRSLEGLQMIKGATQKAAQSVIAASASATASSSVSVSATILTPAPLAASATVSSPPATSNPTLVSASATMPAVSTTTPAPVAASATAPSSPSPTARSKGNVSSTHSSPAVNVSSFDQYAAKAEKAYKHRIRKMGGKAIEVKTHDDDAEKMGQGVKKELEKLLTNYQSGLFSVKPEDDESVKLAKKLQAEEFERAGFKKPR